MYVKVKIHIQTCNDKVVFEYKSKEKNGHMLSFVGCAKTILLNDLHIVQRIFLDVYCPKKMNVVQMCSTYITFGHVGL